MQHYLILKTFKGTQDGLGDGELFTEGAVATLSDRLAEVMLKAGYVKPAERAARDIAKAPPELADAVMETISDVNPAEDRETKVEAPAETKPAKPFKKKSK